MGKDHAPYISEIMQARKLIISLNCLGYILLVSLSKNQGLNYFTHRITDHFVIFPILLVNHKGKIQNIAIFGPLKNDVPDGFFVCNFHWWILRCVSKPFGIQQLKNN